MNQEKIDKIAKIIFPYLKTKHKNAQAQQIAKEILKEIDEEPPTWYNHG